MQQTRTEDSPHCLRPTDSGHSGGLLFIIVLGLALSIAAGLMSGQVMLRRPAAIVPASGAVAVTSGSHVDVVVQVMTLAGDALEVRPLERRGASYAPGAATMQALLSGATRFSMGGRTDLKPGAVLQLRGITQDAAGHTLQVGQAVVLTGYVQVVGGPP